MKNTLILALFGCMFISNFSTIIAHNNAKKNTVKSTSTHRGCKSCSGCKSGRGCR